MFHTFSLFEPCCSVRFVSFALVYGQDRVSSLNRSCVRGYFDFTLPASTSARSSKWLSRKISVSSVDDVESEVASTEK